MMARIRAKGAGAEDAEKGAGNTCVAFEHIVERLPAFDGD